MNNDIKELDLDVREDEDDLVKFAAFHGLTYNEAVTLPALIDRIAKRIGVRAETISANIATFDNELARYIASVARRVASDLDVFADNAPA